MTESRAKKIKKIKLAPGLYWVEIAEKNLRMLGGVPPDAMKYLAAKDMISAYKLKGHYTEKGPNSLLLNEEHYVKGMVANLAEFPILQMFYMQGMGLVFHPNFKKEKPLIIGMEKRVKSQLDYIKYGNNGLGYPEMLSIKTDSNTAYIWSFMKAKFASSLDILSLIDCKYINKERIEIKPKVFLERKSKNFYEISYKGETVDINLNLENNESFRPPYQLKKTKLPKATFAVVNTGTGDGWNFRNPCFGSLIVNSKKNYLVDCEVFVEHALESLSISMDDISGIFMTHAHDDHMSGLPVLYKKQKPVNIYATSLIYHSLMMKITALLGISKADFKKVFIKKELKYDKWQNLSGLEIKPVHSAHPIETSIFFFRVKDKQKYKIYGHLGDIAPISVIKKFRSASISDEERDFYNKMIVNYLDTTDLKKIDIGGGMIHGVMADFSKDNSTKKILGHYHRKLTKLELSEGVEQEFGDYDVLIP